MIKQYLVALVTFLIVDGVWLTVIAKNFYAKYLGYLMSKNPNLLAAGIFYLVYILGLVILVLTPALKENSLAKAIFLGGCLGFVSYATYDLTNLATIKDWPMIITIIDIIWGTVLTALVSGISFWIIKR